MSAVVTLMTDFGARDGYVAEMKGVLLGVNPEVTLVDVTHEIMPQDVQHGAYVLSTIARRFPVNTVHLAVVDPGVGSERKALAASCHGSIFIGPDNGLMSSVLTDPGLAAVREISNPDMIAPVVSPTFHGRDVFAHAAGHAASGSAIEAFGPSIVDPVLLESWGLRDEGNRITGCVVHVDRFGNLITNVGLGRIAKRNVVEVQVAGFAADGLHTTYAGADPGSLLALVGSQETVEISVNGGNASDVLKVGRGAEVVLIYRS